MTQALAAVLRERHGSFRIEEIEVSDPGPGEVLVAIRGCGICHTDLDVRDGWHSDPLPVVLGHEGAGVVVDVGPGVLDITEGDHVVLGFPSCGDCGECAAGRPYNCPDLDEIYHRCERKDGTQPFTSDVGVVRGFFAGQSSFASHTIVAAKNAVRVSREFDITTLGPLGCGISTGAGAVLNDLRPEVGSAIAIFGLGGVGLSAVMAARLCGCSAIVAVDVLQDRLELALDLGATTALNAQDEDVVRQVREACGGGAHHAVEAAGRPEVVLNAILSLRDGGHCVFAGNQPDGAILSLPLGSLEFSQSLRGSVLGRGAPRQFIPFLLQLHAVGRLPFDRLVRRYAFADIATAVDDAERGRTIKPILVMP